MSEPPKKKATQRVSFAKIKVEPQEIQSAAKQVENERDSDRCSICWNDPPINAIRLDCSHLFCFLCIKSVAAATGRCALCRSEIDKDFDFGEFELVGEPQLPVASPDGRYWFYEGKIGWWLYDADTNKELEEAHKDGKKQIEKLISGQVYVINLTSEKQYQKSDPSRSRKICRHKLDLSSILGMAGIRDKNLLYSLRRRQGEEYVSSKLPANSNITNNNNTKSPEDGNEEDLRF